MRYEIRKIIDAIPGWSRKFQGVQSFQYIRELGSANNFVTDYSGNHWTYGKSVGDDGDYHRDGAGARRRLEELGFKDILSSSYTDKKKKRKVEEKFRKWAEKVRAQDLNKKLDRYLDRKLGVKFRLLIPPNF